jgi:hypothetical protein
MIEIELLDDAVLKQYKKSETIFEKDHLATQYYQIISGTVKINNFMMKVEFDFYRITVLVSLRYFWTESTR